MEFEWDPAKARANEANHGIDFEEALTVFWDPLARIFDDEEHSEVRTAGDHYWAFARTASPSRMLHDAWNKDSTDQRTKSNAS